MRARLRYAADLLRNSYWFTPGLMMIGAFALSVITLRLDARWGMEALREIEWLYAWTYTGGPDGAADVLSVIASSMITVAGVVFSITIVALTLASSQFGPRVLASFMADRGNQIVLGTFIATFLYSLLVLRTIRGDGARTDVLVPHLSVTVSLLLAIASLCVLIFFIHHVSISIQAPHLIAVVARELHHSVSMLPRVGDGDGEMDGAGPSLDGGRSTPDPPGEAAVVPVPDTGYIEAIDFEGLVKMADEEDLFVRLRHRPGHFVAEGRTLALVWPADRVTDASARRIGGFLATGARRTAIQDMEFPVAQLVEIAVRALSPGINDPYTAITCIDQISAGLCNLAGRALPPARFQDSAGLTRVVVERPVTFEGVVRQAFDQVRQNAAHHTAVHLRLLESLTRVIGAVEDPSRIDPLATQARLIMERARTAVPTPADVREIETEHDGVLEAAERRRRRLAGAPGGAEPPGTTPDRPGRLRGGRARP